MRNDNTNRQTTRRILRIAGAAVFATVTIAAPNEAHAQAVTPPPVPDTIQVPEGNTPFLLGRGVGTQNYVCVPSPTVGKANWQLFTPEATLFNDQGEQLTTHFFGPNPEEPSSSPFETGLVRAAWQDSRDTSSVWGAVVRPSSDANFVAPGAIPWLLIETVGTAVGPTGGSTLTKTTFIQRLNTAGGAAPSVGCSLPTDIGRKAFVPYTADYFFFQELK